MRVGLHVKIDLVQGYGPIKSMNGFTPGRISLPAVVLVGSIIILRRTPISVMTVGAVTPVIFMGGPRPVYGVSNPLVFEGFLIFRGIFYVPALMIFGLPCLIRDKHVIRAIDFDLLLGKHEEIPFLEVPYMLEGFIPRQDAPAVNIIAEIEGNGLASYLPALQEPVFIVIPPGRPFRCEVLAPGVSRVRIDPR